MIELLVVIAIIGLLATIVMVSLNNAREKAKRAKAMADVNQIRTAVELYYAENGDYPCPGEYFPAELGNPVSCLQPALAPYLKAYPTTDPWGSYYVWHYNFGTVDCNVECISVSSMGADGNYEDHCISIGDDYTAYIAPGC